MCVTELAEQHSIEIMEVKLLKKLIFVPLFLFAILLTGCSNDPVQDDLLNYINKEIDVVADLENKAVSKYESVTGVNYTNDQTLYDALLGEILPTYQDFLKKLEAISLETDEVKKIHEKYIEAANLQYDAFVKILSALQKQDITIIEEANGMLADARKMLRDYQEDIKKLAKEHDVELKKNKENAA